MVESRNLDLENMKQFWNQFKMDIYLSHMFLSILWQKLEVLK
jgi:hypothetical protein